MSTSAERTYRVPKENRTVFIVRHSSVEDRIVHINYEDRVVYMERGLTSADRTVYATED